MSDQIVSTAGTNLFNSNSSFQSLFRLPTIFMMVMVILELGFMIYENSQGPYVIPFSRFNGYASVILNVSMLSFFIAMVMFVDQKMHQITVSTLIIIIVTGIMYESLVITLRCQEVQPYLLLLLKPIILIMLIKLVGQFGKTERTTYHLTLGNNRIILAILFTMMFLIPQVVIFLPAMTYLSMDLIRSLSGLIYRGSYLLGILCSLMVFFCNVINFLIIFFSVKNCFNREVDNIPLKSLFKAIGWSYLLFYSFFAIAIFTVLVIFATIPDRRLPSEESIISVFTIINLIAEIKLTRKAVRKYFS